MPVLQAIKRKVEALSKDVYNFVLVNRYRNGYDSIGSHRDDEVDLDEACSIASVSLGETRTMIFERAGAKRHAIDLIDGSVLVMRPPTNRHWSHRIPKESHRPGVRINLTFRRIKRTCRT